MSTEATTSKSFTHQTEPFRWEDIPLLAYKEEGTHFHKITRQVLFEGGEKLGCQWRYFEISEGGHSTLEKHDHIHSVMIIRGKGEAFVGDEVRAIGTMDLVYIPSMTWHQFRANQNDYLGFLCLVNCDRDRPIRPTDEDLRYLRQNPKVAEFIRT